MFVECNQLFDSALYSKILLWMFGDFPLAIMGIAPGVHQGDQGFRAISRIDLGFENGVYLCRIGLAASQASVATTRHCIYKIPANSSGKTSDPPWPFGNRLSFKQR